ncbi:MAG: hypothetical protein Tsb002_36590 [Wenzhouxiangellaceae bacterium]
MLSLFKKKPRPWLSDDSRPYPHDAPNFYDPAEHPWVPQIEAQWQVIRDELLEVVKENNDDMDPYVDLEKTDKDAAWKTAGLMYWTIKSPKNIKKFPKTWEIFRDLPNLSSCSLHLLEPGASIKPHIGDTDAMYRCHMGLVVPAGLPRCGFRVEDEMVEWKEGKIFIFNDACTHTAWNNTDKNRYVISFDIMRPEFAKRKYWIASQVLGKIFAEVSYQHNAWLRKYFNGRWFRAIYFPAAKGFIRTLIFFRLPLYNLL